MIIRRWTGLVLNQKADEYVQLMRDVAIPDYRAIDGNIGAMCLRADRGQMVEVTMLTFWRDMEAVIAFAGAEPELAKYYSFDADFLLWKSREVEHATAAGVSFAADSSILLDAEPAR